MAALVVDADGAVAWGATRPSWYIFPGKLVPDGEGGFMKQPLGRWTRDATRGDDADGIRALWDRLVGTGKAVMCVACAPSGIWVLDDDRDVDPETGWPALLAEVDTLTLRSCTKGRPHYVFPVADDGWAPNEGRWPGGDVKSSGIIFIGDGPPINDAPITWPSLDLIRLLSATRVRSGGRVTREAASTEEMWDWISSTEDEDLILHGAGPEKFLGVILRQFETRVDDGDHRRQACRDAVWSAAKEAAAGYYFANNAYFGIRDLYQEMRETSEGAKGWTEDRLRDYDLMWAGAVAAVLSGDLDDELAEKRSAVGVADDGDEDWYTFLEGLSS